MESGEKIKIEITIPQELLERIADSVLRKILPHMELMQEHDLYLNVEEVAVMLGKSRGQIYQWVDRANHGLSDFPYKKAGRSLRFSQKEIKEWLQKRQ